MKTRTLLIILLVIWLFPGRALAHDYIRVYVQNDSTETIDIQVNYSGYSSGQCGPTSVGAGQSSGDMCSFDIEDTGGGYVQGYFTVNGVQMPSAYGWQINDPNIGHLELATSTNYVTLTNPGSGVYHLNLDFNASPVTTPGVIFGGQATVNGNYCFFPAFAANAGSFSSGGTNPFAWPCQTKSQDTAYPINAMAADSYGWVVSAYEVVDGGSCSSSESGATWSVLYEALSPSLGGGVVVFCGLGPGSCLTQITAVTPPLPNGNFFAGSYGSQVSLCNPSNGNTSIYFTTPNPVAALALDPINHVLWVGDTGGHLYECPMTSSLPANCTLFNTFTSNGQNMPIISIAASNTESLLAVSTLDGYLWACGVGQNPPCWSQASSQLPQPSSGSTPTLGYMNLAWAQGSVFAVYSWLNAYLPSGLSPTSEPWKTTTIISTGMRAGPALFAGVDASGIATDGTNVYALSDDGYSIYVCPVGATNQSQCAQWSLDTSYPGASGFNITTLGSTYNYPNSP